MKMSTRQISKQAILGILLLGSVNYAYAQSTDTVTPATETVIQSAQQNSTIEDLKKQLETKPSDNDLLVKLATAYQENKEWNNAIETWQKVSASLPDWAPAYYSTAYAYQYMKDNPNATAAYQKYIATVKPEELDANKKNLAYAHFFVAYSLFETNKEESKNHIAKSLEYDPSNEDAQKLSATLNQ